MPLQLGETSGNWKSQLPKLDVASSILVARSNLFNVANSKTFAEFLRENWQRMTP
jgi:hypothetical protein